MEHLDSEQPFWLLGREPSWQLQRKEQRHGRTLARQN